ncbi:ras-induced vulval development antagonist-domain-containing protein [Pholiota molesta]|nr:ras-induced vulval development antagonist-domain-containing protein [Pholiota molesta]
MATIHPSRMGLIPQEMRPPPPSDRHRGRSPSPRRPRRSPSPRRSRERGRDGGSRRDDGYDSRERGRDSYRPAEPRRPSPKYEDYRRAPPPPPPPQVGGEPSAPWRQQENMYPGRREHGGPPHGIANTGFLESRRAQREAQTVYVWPPSPKAPARELSPKGKKSSKKSKRHRSPSPSDTDSSEEERRREKKERKRARRHEKEEKKEKKRHRHKSRHSDDEDEDSDDDHRRHRHRSKRPRSRTRSKSKSARPKSRSRSRTPVRMEEDRERAPKRPRSPALSSEAPSRQVSVGAPPSSRAPGDSDSDEEVGPKPLHKKGGAKKVDERAYGGALLRGEGSAMAAFLQDGTESRIPRRGEIGLTSDEIAKYEDVGYVMSGSRHRRMNAVRMRKENQVISAEEKRGILKLQREERERKEAILRDEFSQLVDERLKGTGAAPTS